MYEMEECRERVILVGVDSEGDSDIAASLKELEELASTAGAEVAASVIQKREAVHPGTYIGKGKIEEIRQMLYLLDANGVICDDELSPAQMNNLEQELECKVMDRTLLILDIFCGKSQNQRGKDPGGAGPAEIPAGTSGRPAELPFPSGRRNRHQRPRREEAGDGPPAHLRTDRISAEGAGGGTRVTGICCGRTGKKEA